MELTLFPYTAGQVKRPQLMRHIASLLGLILPLTVDLSGAVNSSTYTGDENVIFVRAITTDALGNTYLTGIRETRLAPRTRDVFVVKQDAAGDVAFMVSVGGPDDDVTSIATDPGGNIYVAGRSRTDSSGPDGFLIKLNPDGFVLYRKDLDDTGLDAVSADAQGNAYVAGVTLGVNHPQTSGSPAAPPHAAFFAKISASGDQILYAGAVRGADFLFCDLLTCSSTAAANSIAVDAQGNAYIAGNTNTTDMPVTPGALEPHGVGAFVAKINLEGTGFVYLTYLDYNLLRSGPLWPTMASAIAIDAEGRAYVAGATTNPEFPVTPNAYQTACGPATRPWAPYCGFVAKLSPDGGALEWASYFGEDLAPYWPTLALDPTGEVWVTGHNSPPPDTEGLQVSTPFLVEFDATGSELLYSTSSPPGYLIALDPNGALHIGGQTGVVATITEEAPSTPLIAGIAAGGSLERASGVVAPAEVISIYGTDLSDPAPIVATPDSAGFYPTLLGGTEVIIGGVRVPLLYMSDRQINAVTPVELSAPGTTTIQIVRDGIAAPPFRAVVSAGLPAIFHGSYGPAVLNQDGSLNSIGNPAKIGSVLQIWSTGLRPQSGINGFVSAAANNNCVCSVQFVKSVPDGETPPDPIDAQVHYCGDAPGIVFGVTQINVQIPENLTPERNELQIQAGDGLATIWPFLVP